MKVTAILRPFGGISKTDDLMLFGINSTKFDEFLFETLTTYSSTSLVDILPLNNAEAARCLGSESHI